MFRSNPPVDTAVLFSQKRSVLQASQLLPDVLQCWQVTNMCACYSVALNMVCGTKEDGAECHAECVWYVYAVQQHNPSCVYILLHAYRERWRDGVSE